MIMFQTFLRSLLLASAFSFAAPLILIGAVLLSLDLIGHIPLLGSLSHSIVHQILQFLNVFGNGDPWQGTLVIGTAFSLVGALFDTYAFYRHHQH
jgi:hypothetical protein